MTKDELTREVAAILVATGAVPLPGGHGLYFSGLRRRHRVVGQAPAPAVRCYVCITLLGETGAEEKWNARAWLPHAGAWFDVYAPALGLAAVEPRWSLMLDGMFALALEWTREPARRHLEAHLRACARDARDRMRRFYRRAGEGLLSQPLPTPLSAPLEPRCVEWDVAESVLEGEQGALAQGLYVLHVLHASLGLAQPDPDQPYENRRVFYQSILSVLRASAGGCGLCATASGLADALSTLALFNRPGGATAEAGRLAAGLPPCFGVAYDPTPAPARALVAASVGSPRARAQLMAAHDLGEAVADLILDPLRAGQPGVPGLQASDYGYLDSVLRYGARRKAAALRSASASGEGAAVAPHQLLTRSFVERMAEERLGARWREAAGLTREAGLEVCAVCHGASRGAPA